MSLMQKHLGDSHGHADHRSGTLVRRARLYELSAAIQFLGRRRAVYDGLVAQTGAKPGDQVLDVGCGTGYFTRRAARVVSPGGHVIGIDPSHSVIDYARGNGPASCTFQLASAQALPYPDASFDVVISSLALHHLAPDDRPTALLEAYRVLRPGGRLLIGEFRRRPLHITIATHLLGARAGHVAQPDPIADLADLIAQAGFDVTGSGDRRPWFQYAQARRA